MKKRYSLLPQGKYNLIVGNTFVVRTLYITAYSGRIVMRYQKQYHSVWMGRDGCYHLKNDEKAAKK